MGTEKKTRQTQELQKVKSVMWGINQVTGRKHGGTWGGGNLEGSGTPLCRGSIWAESSMMRSGQVVPGRRPRECRGHRVVIWLWSKRKK